MVTYAFLKIFKTFLRKTIGLLRKFQNNLPRFPFITIYKFFIRPHLDYRNIFYETKRLIILFMKDSNRFNIAQQLPW